MQFKAIFTFIAAGLSLVSATKPDDVDTTTTSTQTSTMTMTLTVTQCAPGVSSCPGAWPAKNHTATVPSWHHDNSTTVVVIPTGGSPTAIITGPAGGVVPTKSAPAPVATGAASGLVFQSGLMLGVLGAGIALLA
ncbi:hypothetical protein QBC39DRAFT_121510 [Podospora conica]|nr:hypothetical protein QBC39DRAFT_121510 [Schizothecium conicum]